MPNKLRPIEEVIARPLPPREKRADTEREKVDIDPPPRPPPQEKK